MCRTNTILDPILLLINKLIDNKENKYSPLNKISIDLISDLHIDQWSTKHVMKHPYGEIKDIPYI